MLYDKRWENVETKEGWRTVLLNAADLVERGWCRGHYCVRFTFEEYPRFCAMGAIRHAAVISGIDAGHDALTRLEINLNQPNITKWNIVEWNDHLAKDGAEVAAKMREVANAV